MKPDEINAAIAEWMGDEPSFIEWWAYKHDDTGGSICMSFKYKKDVEDWIAKNPEYAKGYSPKEFKKYPDYYGDLNEIHKAISKLEPHMYYDYTRNVRSIVLTGSKEDLMDIDFYEPKAFVKCEALLRTISLWRDL